jgi:hypothetical protein
MFLNGLITNDSKNARSGFLDAGGLPDAEPTLATVRVIPREDGFLLDTSGTTRVIAFARAICARRRFSVGI